MFSSLPRRQRILVKTSLSIAWGLSALAGLSTFVLSWQAYIEDLGPLLTTIIGVLLFASSAMAVYGVLSDRYRLEWVPSWTAALALVPYLVALWAGVLFGGEYLAMPQGFVMASLMGFYLNRAMMCGAHAEKLRKDHLIATKTLERIEHEQDESGAG